MSRSSRRALLRAGTVLTAATVVGLIGAAPAFAHVTAQPGTAKQGGYAVVTFRVPNESDTAGTVALSVSLPTDRPISSVRTTPIPGWTATTTMVTLNPPVEATGRTITETVGTVTWTAAPGTRIGPGEFLDFPVSLGRLPDDIDTLTLPTTQTYDDGKVVAWNEPKVAGQPEPEHPAPTVTLTPAEGGAAAAPAAAASEGDSTARWLGGAGLLVGALGVGVGGGAVLRNRRADKVS